MSPKEIDASRRRSEESREPSSNVYSARISCPIQFPLCRKLLLGRTASCGGSGSVCVRVQAGPTTAVLPVQTTETDVSAEPRTGERPELTEAEKWQKQTEVCRSNLSFC